MGAVEVFFAQIYKTISHLMSIWGLSACGNRVGIQKTMINNVWEMIHETKIMIDIVLQLLLFVVVSNY